jgi:hypothetical protein
MTANNAGVKGCERDSLQIARRLPLPLFAESSTKRVLGNPVGLEGIQKSRGCRYKRRALAKGIDGP